MSDDLSRFDALRVAFQRLANRRRERQRLSLEDAYVEACWRLQLTESDRALLREGKIAEE